MKNKLLTFILLAASVFLTNCAKSGGRSASQVGTTALCSTPGYVSTTAGCIPQGNCPAGYGQAGNQCHAMTNGYNMGGACSTGYGYSNNSCYGINGGTVGGGTCAPGYVRTAIDCLPQGSCPAGYGYYYGNYNGQMGAWCYPQTY